MFTFFSVSKGMGWWVLNLVKGNFQSQGLREARIANQSLQNASSGVSCMHHIHSLKYASGKATEFQKGIKTANKAKTKKMEGIHLLTVLQRWIRWAMISQMHGRPSSNTARSTTVLFHNQKFILAFKEMDSNTDLTNCNFCWNHIQILIPCEMAFGIPRNSKE